MRRLIVDGQVPDAATISIAAAVIRADGLVAYPTETFYGLAADARSDRAIAALFAAKGRIRDKGIPIIAGSIDQLLAEGAMLSPLARRLAERFWPGPLSLVIPCWPGLSEGVNGGTRTVAVRVSSHIVACELALAFGHPITATSANLSGGPSPADADAVSGAIGSSLDLLLDGGSTPGGNPSTLVDVTGAAPSLIRPGAVPWEQVLECLG